MAEDTRTGAVLTPPPPTPPTRAGTGESPIGGDAPRGGWDFLLMMLTVVLLGALGVQSLVGTGIVWYGQRTDPAWMDTKYTAFVSGMDAVAAPIVVALVVVMGLCVPKRLFSRRLLLGVSAAMVAVGAAAGLLAGSLSAGLAAYLVLAALIQVAVVVMTALGVGSLTYLTLGKVTRIGSGLLHLGFVVFLLVVVALQDSPWMLPVFTASAILLTGGAAMSFYAGAIADTLRPDLDSDEWAEEAEDADVTLGAEKDARHDRD